MTTQLDPFGKLIITSLRDNSFEFFERLVQEKWKSPGLLKLQSDLQSLSNTEVEIVRRCVRATIDTGIHDFLSVLYAACESGVIDLRVGGRSVTELSDGLHLELFTDEGWEARFSKFGQSPEDD